MAQDHYKEKTHAFIAIEKDLKEGKIPRLVLLCGKEEYLINWYTETLIQRYVSDVSKALDLVTLQGDSLQIQQIKESLETVSLMSRRKVVLIPEFPPVYGKGLKGFPDGDVKELESYFSQLPEDCLLLITATEGEDYRGNKSHLMKAIEKQGKVYDFQSLRENQLRSFIEKRFNSVGKTYRPSVITMIITGSGYGNKAIDYTLYNLENDLKKIIAHSGSEPEITAADVSDVLSTNPEHNVFAMLDAIGRNRKDEAFRLLHNLLHTGTPVFNLLYLITGQLELILTVKEMREEGLSLGEMQKKLKVHQFRIKKAMSVTGQYSVPHLKTILSKAYQVDEHIKTGIMDGPLALEYFIASL